MARRWRKLVVLCLAVLIVVVALCITFTIGWRPFIGPKTRALTARRFESTPARLARGKYLVDAVAGCLGCHSPADFTTRGAPPVDNKLGAGASWPDKQLPWLVAANISPDKETGAGNWSDDVWARAIREGIGHDGRALFPVMPYPNFRSMSDEDLASIVVYMRSLTAVRNQLPPTKIPFPMNFLIKSIPEPVTAPVTAPDSSTMEARGAYLIKIAGCADCHTPQDRGQPIAGLDFAGGSVFDIPTGRVVSSNITPDSSGISYYDEKLFIAAMRSGRVGARELSPAMPWSFFGKMTDDDLRSVFAYLRALKPVQHRVDNAESPTTCKLCRQKHGVGDQN